MKTTSKIWLGVGAFALVQAVGVTMEAGRPTLTIAQPAEAACGWSRTDSGRWYYDSNCERGERYNASPQQYYYNERGERWNGHDNGYHRGWYRDNRGRYHEQGERWGERGERWGG